MALLCCCECNPRLARTQVQRCDITVVWRRQTQSVNNDKAWNLIESIQDGRARQFIECGLAAQAARHRQEERGEHQMLRSWMDNRMCASEDRSSSSVGGARNVLVLPLTYYTTGIHTNQAHALSHWSYWSSGRTALTLASTRSYHARRSHELSIAWADGDCRKRKQASVP